MARPAEFYWHTNKLDGGFTMIAVDVALGETLFGLRHAISEEQAKDPELLRIIITHLGSVAAAAWLASRACAFEPGRIEPLTEKQYMARLREVTLSDGRVLREP